MFAEQASAKFYSVDGLLVLILPINYNQEPNQKEQNSTISIQMIQDNKFSPSSYGIDLSHEYILTPKDEDTENTPPKKKKIKEETNIEEASYEKLYEDIVNEKKFSNSLSSQINSLSLNSSNQQKSSKKVGRNENCPCGSGKKYKFCHGKK